MKNKKIASFLVLAAVLTGGVVAYEHFTFKRLSAQLLKQTEEISTGYQTLASEHLLPLQEEYALTANQERLIERVKESQSKLEEASALEEKLQGIGALQVALVAFLQTTTADQGFVKNESFVQLQKEMGERGSMREKLNAYNTTALRWNRKLQSELGSLTSRVGGSQRNLLPYLRFDGEQEFVTIVEL